MPVCSIVKLLPLGTVDDLMHYCTRPSVSCNSASGRPQPLGVIIWTILQTGMKKLYNMCSTKKLKQYFQRKAMSPPPPPPLPPTSIGVGKHTYCSLLCHNVPSIISRESMHKHNFGQLLKLQSAVVTMDIRSRSLNSNSLFSVSKSLVQKTALRKGWMHSFFKNDDLEMRWPWNLGQGHQNHINLDLEAGCLKHTKTQIFLIWYEKIHPLLYLECKKSNFIKSLHAG